MCARPISINLYYSLIRRYVTSIISIIIPIDLLYGIKQIHYNIFSFGLLLSVPWVHDNLDSLMNTKDTFESLQRGALELIANSHDYQLYRVMT